MNLSKFTSSIRFKLLNQAYYNWIKKGDKILDIGCGNGIIAKLLKDNFEISITGCDVKNYLIYDLPFIKVGYGDLSLIRKKFDIAMLNDVLHHMPKDEQKKLILESLNIAKKLLIFEAEPTLNGKIADLILNKYHYGNMNVPLSFRSIKDWQKLFKKLPLKSKIIRIKKPLWYPFSHIAILLKKE